MRDIKERRWYQRMKQDKPNLSEEMTSLGPVVHVDVPTLEVANEADRSLRKMKEKGTPLDNRP